MINESEEEQTEMGMMKRADHILNMQKISEE